MDMLKYFIIEFIFTLKVALFRDLGMILRFFGIKFDLQKYFFLKRLSKTNNERIRQLLTSPPMLESGTKEYVGLYYETLLYLDNVLKKNDYTLETGSGISTIFFLIKETNHIAISPNADECELIKKYCEMNDISLKKLQYYIDFSEKLLPKLELADESLDSILIDGCHGFPYCSIDWFYLKDKLKINGLLVLDDIDVFSCNFLYKFLCYETENWKLVYKNKKSAVFKKINKLKRIEWFQQRYIVMNTLLHIDRKSAEWVAS